MNSSNTIKNVLLVIFLSTNIFRATSSCSGTRKYTARITNSLPRDSAPLHYHCGSDLDFGTKVLREGQTAELELCVSPIVEYSAFACRLRWGSKIKTFEIFNSKSSDECKSHVCSWSVMGDGIYYQDGPSGKLSKKYDWDSNAM
ncbi:hypothetical protein ABFS82_03G049600 [Erythranthe guttata]|uniref:S-protein homolog n=1 Tax=Erythranthe guttata TaxID=4155 RepID=A0A022QCJ6_ERYGU|nr:hypothetical protein MIMGU_mgv11b013258mg [Erythranthe guttata]